MPANSPTATAPTTSVIRSARPAARARVHRRDRPVPGHHGGLASADPLDRRHHPGDGTHRLGQEHDAVRDARRHRPARLPDGAVRVVLVADGRAGLRRRGARLRHAAGARDDPPPRERSLGRFLRRGRHGGNGPARAGRSDRGRLDPGRRRLLGRAFRRSFQPAGPRPASAAPRRRVASDLLRPDRPATARRGTGRTRARVTSPFSHRRGERPRTHSPRRRTRFPSG